MKKFLIVFMLTSILSACYISPHTGPIAGADWRLDDVSDDDEYLDRLSKDFSSCHYDIVIGGGAYGALCLEQKGWRYDKGPACVDKVMVDWYKNPLCVKWREQHGE